MLKSIGRVVAIGCFLTLIIGENSQATENKILETQYDFKIHGSNTVGEKFAPILLEKFLTTKGYTRVQLIRQPSPVEKRISATNPLRKKSVNVDLAAHGSSTGFVDLLAGNTDIAMSSRPIKPEEMSALGKIYPSIGRGEAENIIAYDALAVVVHPDNPINNITLGQLAAIYSGEISNWQDVGGIDARINVLARDDNSGTYDTFKKLVLKTHDKTLINSSQRFESSQKLTKTVAENPAAIGFVGISHTQGAKVLAVANELGARGIRPDEYTIGTEDYPLSRKLFLYFPTENDNVMAREFVQFVTGEQGQRLASRADLISFFPTSSKPNLAGKEVERKYAHLADFGKRLSVTLRLSEEGSLTSKLRRDLERLIQFKRANPHNRIVLAGFWDDPDMSQTSLQQVESWMSVIKEVLLAQQIEPWSVHGGFLPIENNELDSGRAMNRRVEVWTL
ncbi:substrate-binding domain-containing protein [Pleionea sediminis]|uniref:substrate-binding domain-containing protein n=1 Tax=Pleionea sediminis TaxID=2569479 RepID=UPI00118527B6|nr:substrate-binding domain-containing protein [Pleionea sediminis]